MQRRSVCEGQCLACARDGSGRRVCTHCGCYACGLCEDIASGTALAANVSEGDPTCWLMECATCHIAAVHPQCLENYPSHQCPSCGATLQSPSLPPEGSPVRPSSGLLLSLPADDPNFFAMLLRADPRVPFGPLHYGAAKLAASLSSAEQQSPTRATPRIDDVSIARNASGELLFRHRLCAASRIKEELQEEHVKVLERPPTDDPDRATTWKKSASQEPFDLVCAAFAKVPGVIQALQQHEKRVNLRQLADASDQRPRRRGQQVERKPPSHKHMKKETNASSEESGDQKMPSMQREQSMASSSSSGDSDGEDFARERARRISSNLQKLKELELRHLQR